MPEVLKHLDNHHSDQGLVVLDQKYGRSLHFSRLTARIADVQKLGYRRDKLSRRKWLHEQDAVRHPVRCPVIGSGTRHVDNRERRFDLPGLLRHFLTGHAAPEIDVRD